MKATGIFVTKEELEAVRTEQECSGMFLSGGKPLGDPQGAVSRLTEKYSPPADSGLSLQDGQFYQP